jgi:hypothetical protein
MKTLSKVIVDVAAFLELSGDEVIDPDSAIKTMEMIRSELKEATPEEKKAIAAAATAAAVSARSHDASEIAAEDGLGKPGGFSQPLTSPFGIGGKRDCETRCSVRGELGTLGGMLDPGSVPLSRGRC